MENIKTRLELSKYINDNKDKHIIIKAGATWCGPCKKMKPLFNNLLCELSNNNKNSNIVYLELDVDVDKDCCNFLRIKGIPHILYIKEGELNQSMVGFESEKLCKLFKYINKEIQLCNEKK